MKKIFENFEFLDRRKGTFDFGRPLKISIVKNSKIIVEISFIAHSIKNFMLKNIKNGHISIKVISDEIWRYV